MISFFLSIAVLSGITIAIVTIIISQNKKTPKWATLLTGVLSIVIIVCGIFEALEQSKKDKEILHSITGGDSFCYLEFSPTPSENTFEVFLISNGKYLLYDVGIRIYDITMQHELKYLTSENLNKIQTYYDIKNLFPGTSINLGTIDISKYDNQDYNIFFIARNGQWIQQTRIQKINNKWLKATQVLKGKSNLYENIMKGFPLNKNKEVDW